MAQNTEEKSILSTKLAKKLLISLMFVFIFDFFLFPAPVLASNDADIPSDVLDETIMTSESEEPEPVFNASLPENNNWNVIRSGYYEITSYTSEVAQCDASPCITANGFNVCEHGIEDTVAANFLKFGTRVKIPQLFGDRIFVVRDRMNAKYDHRMDIWMKDKKVAIKFGLKYAKIEILEEP
jgi:3D (Asp-Asp-Asp) domain-containing protein